MGHRQVCTGTEGESLVVHGVSLLSHSIANRDIAFKYPLWHTDWSEYRVLLYFIHVYLRLPFPFPLGPLPLLAEEELASEMAC